MDNNMAFLVLLNSTMTSDINEIYGESTLVQTYKNTSDKPLEVKLALHLRTESILHKLTIQLRDKTVYARIREKTKAKEAYSDSIASGNLAIEGDYLAEEFYQLNIGNIPPLESLTITTSMIQFVESESEKYCFKVSLGAFPFLKLCPQEQKLIAVFSSSNCPLTVISPNEDNAQEAQAITLNGNEEAKLFFTGPHHKSIQLFEEYDNAKDLYAYTIHYYYHTEAKEINETPGIFYFLLDQSGSMQGKSIELAKNALLLFLQSLPVGSYFHLIGFGSNCVEYTKELMPYTEEGLKHSGIIEVIKSLEASLGETELLEPLNLIFNSITNLKLSKNVFVLTDGRISNANQCYELISKHNDDYRIHSIGIGKDFDKKLIEKMGTIGKGTSSFVRNLNKLNVNVVDALNKALRLYLKNVSLFIECEKMLEYPPRESTNVMFKGEFLNYSFITKKQLVSKPEVIFSAFDPVNRMEIREVRSIEVIKLPNGNALNKTIVGRYLKNCVKDDKLAKKEMIRLSVEYQVLSLETTLIAELELRDKSSQKMEVIDFSHLVYNDNRRRGRPRKQIEPNDFSSKSGNRSRSRSRDKEYNRDKDKAFNDIIRSQNMFDGSWSENTHTKFFLTQMEDKDATLSAFKQLFKEKNIDESLHKQIIFTFLVIIFIKEKHSDKLQEVKLIVSKAEKFLLNNNVPYEDIRKRLLDY